MNRATTIIFFILAVQSLALAQKYSNPGTVAPLIKPNLSFGKNVLISGIQARIASASYTVQFEYNYHPDNKLKKVSYLIKYTDNTSITNLTDELFYDARGRLFSVNRYIDISGNTPYYRYYSFTYDDQSKIVNVIAKNEKIETIKVSHCTYPGSDVVCKYTLPITWPVTEADINKKTTYKRSNDGKYNVLRITNLERAYGNSDRWITDEMVISKYTEAPIPTLNLPAGYNCIYLPFEGYFNIRFSGILFSGSKNLVKSFTSKSYNSDIGEVKYNSIGFVTKVKYSGGLGIEEFNFQYYY